MYQDPADGSPKGWRAFMALTCGLGRVSEKEDGIQHAAQTHLHRRSRGTTAVPRPETAGLRSLRYSPAVLAEPRTGA